MITFLGGATVVAEVDHDVTYTEIESALQAEGFLEGYLINRAVGAGSTQLTVSVHVPMSMITGDGVPKMEAVQVLRSLANALETVDRKAI